MAIQGTNPIVVPETTYDQWWMTMFNVNAPSPTQKINAQFVLIPMASASGETNASKAVRVQLSDVMALVGTDTDVAAAFNAVLAAVQKIARAQGKI